jgi:hypothetical protein
MPAGNLDALLAGIKRIAAAGTLLPVASPPSIVANFPLPFTPANNATTGQVDITWTATVVTITGGLIASNPVGDTFCTQCNGSISQNATVTFPGVFGVWLIDTNGVTFNGHSITAKAGSGASVALGAEGVTYLLYGDGNGNMYKV